MMGFNFFFLSLHPIRMAQLYVKIFMPVLPVSVLRSAVAGLLRYACVLDMSEFENEILKGKILDLLP